MPSLATCLGPRTVHATFPWPATGQPGQLTGCGVVGRTVGPFLGPLDAADQRRGLPEGLGKGVICGGDGDHHIVHLASFRFGLGRGVDISATASTAAGTPPAALQKQRSGAGTRPI